uniref:DNA polymerase n=1 Tax=Syphacia muris TaxID=451379 RepID=A0A158R5N5_9BILA
MLFKIIFYIFTLNFFRNPFKRTSISDTVQEDSITQQEDSNLLNFGYLSNIFYSDLKKPEADVEASSSKVDFLYSSEGKVAMKIYWLDAFEDPVKFPGTVYLFGRVINGGLSEGCCVIVKNIWRQIFFLPCEQHGVNTMKCRVIISIILISRKFYFFQSNFPALPTDLKGRTFSHVFNTTSTALERLLIEIGMKGPCWLEIEQLESVPKISYVKHEYVVDMERMKCIRVIECNDTPPVASILGLNIISVTNEAMENEVLPLFFIVFYFFLAFPLDLKTCLKRNKLDTVVKEASNERHLLSQFLCKLQTLDPDAYLGYDLASQFSTLVSRLEKLKMANWSCVGRLRRSIPLKKLNCTKAAFWEVTAGRFALDSRLAAMELVKLRSYDLSEMVESLLQLKRESITEVIDSGSALTKFINHSFYDAWLSLSIISRLNALPLFLKITQIVGGVLSRTLMGGRAERNEFLLLHAFYKNGYVPPNKYQRIIKKKSHPDENYSGGLVLEPKKGLYDTFILLLDFNSLYPSIIQEYNICFTTVDQSKAKDVEEGILPKEIRGLVERRREVKKLMKSEKISEQLRSQYNIRQMGLKLTANSMYGCLGFVQSRFYAKPLAALITSCGREILTHTKDLVEKLGFSVIYGDTDSIMIDTGLLDLEQVKKLGFEIKKAVNKSYKKLELDLDGVYKRLLLLKKKKYVGLAVDLTTGTVKREAKGLDIVRRDWSMLAKDVGNQVVDIILSDMDRDDRIEKIHETLTCLKEKLKDGKEDISKFEIFKQLTRSIDDYGDGKAQPHVAVAQRLNMTGKFHFHRGDIIPYIVCEDGTANSAVQRTYHRSEVLEREDLHIDLHYYLTQQVHPVVCRLCEPIEGTDPVRIAEALGLDPANYRNRIQASVDNEEEDEFSIGVELDYSACEPFVFMCPYENCGKEIVVTETVIQDELGVHFRLDSCPECSRTLLPFSSYISNQLTLSISPVYTCDDALCGFKTRRIPFKVSREGLQCSKCTYGLMKRQVESKQLYVQQRFYRSLFDLRKAITDCKLDEQNFQHVVKLYADLVATCDKYLLKNDFGIVSLSHLFVNMCSQQNAPDL